MSELILKDSHRKKKESQFPEINIQQFIKVQYFFHLRFLNDELTWTLNDQFLWGAALLISPALEQVNTQNINSKCPKTKISATIGTLVKCLGYIRYIYISLALKWFLLV